MTSIRKNVALWSAAALWVSAGVAHGVPVTFREKRANTDWTFAGFGGMSGNGTGTLSLSGVGGPVAKAYLYWGGVTDSTDPAANATVAFNGNTVTGTHLGFSGDIENATANSQGYRADVTALVSGSGTYSLANFYKSGVADVNGVSLYVFFDDGNAVNNRDVYLLDGFDANVDNSFDAPGIGFTAADVQYDGGAARLVMSMAGGQDDARDGAFQLNGSPFLPVPPLEDTFVGQSVPSNGPFPDYGRYDVMPFDITPYLAVGSNTVALSHTIDTDGLALHAAAIDVAAVPEPWRVADANEDGRVDVTDLGVLATNYNDSGPDLGRAGGDFNGDGAVNVADLGLLATYFNQPRNAGGLSFEQAAASFPNLPAVPEPAGAMLFATAGLGLLTRRRRLETGGNPGAI